MKKRRLILVLVVIVLGAPLLLLLKPRPPPLPITSTFLGFPNIPTGPSALFSVANYPEDATHPLVIAMAVQQGESWNKLPQPAGGWPAVHQMKVGLQPEATEMLYQFSVPGTNDPVRVVMQIRTPQRGMRATIERLVARTGLRGGHLFRPPTLYFTNETVVHANAAP